MVFLTIILQGFITINKKKFTKTLIETSMGAITIFQKRNSDIGNTLKYPVALEYAFQGVRGLTF